MQGDEAIIRQVLHGNVNAFSGIVARYERPIYNLHFRLTGSREEALELSQDTFLRAYERLGQYLFGANFFSWLYALALNLGRDRLRRSRPEISLEAAVDAGQPEPMDDSFTEDRLIARLDAARLDKALARLPREQRAALMLRYREDLSMQDIAATFDISVSGAKMRISRGLAALRVLLTEADDAQDA